MHAREIFLPDSTPTLSTNCRRCVSVRISCNLQTKLLVQATTRKYWNLPSPARGRNREFKPIRASSDHFASAKERLNLPFHHFAILITIFFFSFFFIAQINFWGVLRCLSFTIVLFLDSPPLATASNPARIRNNTVSLHLNHIALQHIILSLACLLIRSLYSNRMLGTLDALLCVFTAHYDAALVRLRGLK